MPTTADLVTAGFEALAVAAPNAVFFASVAVLDLAFAATLFTDVLGGWILLGRAALTGRVLRFVAGVLFAEALLADALLAEAPLTGVPLAETPALDERGEGRAVRAVLLLALAVAGFVLPWALGFVAAEDFLLTLFAAVAAFVVAALFLGGMAWRTL